MDTYPWVKKCLMIGIIFLLISITVVHNINLTVAGVSSYNDLAEVTIQACGTKGFADTNVKLTRQQYQNLEQYIVDIRARLNQALTMDDVVPIFMEATVELSKYGLLPKGMSTEQAQKLVLNGYSNGQGHSIFEKNSIPHEILLQNNQNNCCCFVLGVIQDGYATGMIGILGMILHILAIAGFPILLALIGNILMIINEITVTIFPFSLMQSITLFSGNIISMGFLGFKHHAIPSNSGTGKIFGFNGIKLTSIKTGEITLLGFSLAIIDLSHD